MVQIYGFYYWICYINRVLTCVTNMWSSRYVRWSNYISLYMLVFTDMYPFTFLTARCQKDVCVGAVWCTMHISYNVTQLKYLGGFALVCQEDNNVSVLWSRRRFFWPSPRLVLKSRQTSKMLKVPFNMSERKMNQCNFWIEFELNRLEC